MPSVVDICNLALSHIGDRATLSSIDPPEGSAQADHCAQWWPIARDEALSSFDWAFASTVAETAQFATSVEDNPQWNYAYALPADFLVAREVVYADGSTIVFDPQTYTPDFQIGALGDGQSGFFTQIEDIALRYTRKVTDPSKYPAQFVTAISYLMASYLAGPVLKGKTGMTAAQNARAAWNSLSAQAALVSANQGHKTTRHTPSAMRARGYGGGQGIIDQGAYRYSLPYWAR